MTDGPSIPPPPPAAGNSNLISRVMGLITNPAAEWQKIDGESTTLGKLVTTYTLILSAILPIFFILGALLAGGGSGIGSILVIAAIYYALQVGVTIALAFVIDALAGTFGGTKNSTQAAKLAVYGSTPLHIAGVIGILAMQFLIGGLAWLWIVLGVGWGGFLLFLGIPILMRAPADKAPAYAGASAGAWFLLWIVAKLIMDQIIWHMIFGAYYGVARAYGL